jgi:tRNA 2-thiouridine synthesizing protein A
MAKTIDARGLSCPQPVLMTLAAIKTGKENEIVVSVDNDASKENVSRAAASRGWTVAEIDENNGVFNITIREGAG